MTRDGNPSLVNFLIAAAASDGADQTRSGAAVAVDYGELGLVLRREVGAPTDPQPGSSKGKKDTR